MTLRQLHKNYNKGVITLSAIKLPDFKNNKWVRAAIPALLIHCSIGSVYCWSIFSQEIADYVGYSRGAIEWAFSFAIFFLGMSASFMGKVVEKDIHRSSLIATVFFTLGMLGTSFFIYYGGLHQHSIIALLGIYICYGCIMGIGLGVGYLTPVKTLMLWFKDRKGLATGLAVAGFGAAKAFASPIMEDIVESSPRGIYDMFAKFGLVYFSMMYFGHVLLKKPDTWKEIEKEDDVKVYPILHKRPIKRFIGIWVMFYLNITCGLALISQEKMIVRCLGLGAYIGIIATASAIFNAGGRIVFSSLGDKMSNRNCVFKLIFMLSFLFTMAVILFSGMRLGPYYPMIQTIVVLFICMINAGYGGGFSNIPNLLSDYYGMEAISTIHGITLSAWAIAGLTGNQIATWIVSHFGTIIQVDDGTGNLVNVNPTGYEYVIYLLAILYVISFLIAFFIVKKPEADKVKIKK